MGDFFPRDVFLLFGIPVRDTVISTWIMMAIVVAAVVILRRRFPMALEMLVDFLGDTLSEAMGRPAAGYLPFLGALAIFIAAANVLGVLPPIPLPDKKMLPIVSPTRDINTPAALAIVVFFAVHYFGIRAKGGWRYVKDLASPAFILPLEVVSQLSRTLSLTVRLFGNIISMELILAVVYSLVARISQTPVIALLPLIAPLPLTIFSMFTGLLQAYIFTSLATAYIEAGLEDDH